MGTIIGAIVIPNNAIIVDIDKITILIFFESLPSLSFNNSSLNEILAKRIMIEYIWNPRANSPNISNPRIDIMITLSKFLLEKTINLSE